MDLFLLCVAWHWTFRLFLAFALFSAIATLVPTLSERLTADATYRDGRMYAPG